MYNEKITISYDFKYNQIKKIILFHFKGYWAYTWKHIEHSILKSLLRKFIIRHFSRRNLSPTR